MATSTTKTASVFRHTPLELILGLIFTIGMVLLVVFSDVIFGSKADMMDLRARLLPPFVSLNHILGTDPLGRDVLARIAAGGKISLIVGLVSVAGATVIGTIAGLIAGYFRGIADMILMRIADIQLAMPFILMAITFIAIVGPGLSILILLMIVAQWVQYARLVRGLVLSLRDREFIQSARAIGVGNLRIIVHHIVPNIIGPVIVLMTLNIATNILLESSLTFVGLGVDATIPSWGGMLADGRTYVQSAWWVTVFPGFAIMFTVLGLNLLGDWLRDYLDPTREK
ncbi:ABC transporter permease [Neorhizobium sp. P12A]|uniref:ABC transporter permease n=1 Tax=Rhizobium/Agrobacterium group TaxID=227290 RepID=UPI00104E052C|nr:MULTISPECIES: ABC transporter permease [Rhizobium/Agrobacterium group]KAA0697823.1 ABC transporter permease [Neorhizobium sp. P12A]TCR87974.1 peptide/nickel transport system permease protein [Rhizobium sp. BK376]